MNATALVFGARGQIGHFLLPRLRDAGWKVHAATRGPLPAQQDIRWHRIDLFHPDATAPEADVIFSLGPLDGLVSWLERSKARPAQIIAFGSTSAYTKRDSPVPEERSLAARLHAAEYRLHELGATLGARTLVLRPTLIYGTGQDRSLTRVAALAQRWRCFVLPRGAIGQRQPAHAEDLADAAWRAAIAAVRLLPSYDLPGGEVLVYRDMIRRVLSCLQPPARLIEVPPLLLQGVLWSMRRMGWLSDAGAGVVARLRRDLVFDLEPARRDLGYTPRRFEPRATMFAGQ